MPLVLLDRDGVLNVDRPDSVRSPEQLVIIPGAAKAVARLNHAGFTVAVVSNQSIVGRGDIDESMLERIHAKLHDALAEAGAHLDALFICPDFQPSPRRKPAPGMVLEALAQFHAAPETTPFVGDALRDLEAAATAGCPRILVRTGKGAKLEQAGLPGHVLPVAIHDDLDAAVSAILAGVLVTS